MVALSDDRNTKQTIGKQFSGPVGAAVTIYNGAMVTRDATNGVLPAVTGTGLQVVGVAMARADNATGALGDIDVEYEAGYFWMVNDSGTPVTGDDIGSECFAVDDQTVSGDGTGRSIAGTVMDVTAADGVLVKIEAGQADKF